MRGGQGQGASLWHHRPYIVSQSDQAAIMKTSSNVLVTQSCPTLCNPMDCSLPGSPVYGILQARILEWVAIPFPRGSS